MDKFDRAAQRQLLQALYDAYPDELTDEETDALFLTSPMKKPQWQISFILMLKA